MELTLGGFPASFGGAQAVRCEVWGSWLDSQGGESRRGLDFSLFWRVPPNPLNVRLTGMFCGEELILLAAESSGCFVATSVIDFSSSVGMEYWRNQAGGGRSWLVTGR